MNLIGLDLNATRMLTVIGPEGVAPRSVPLDGTDVELRLVVSLEHRKLQVGQAGVALSRRLPHLACTDFLAHLGEGRTWSAGRHRLDADKAITLALERLRSACGSGSPLAAALPAYLARGQIERLALLAEKAKLPMLGSAVASLALALAAHAEQPWSGPAIVAYADDHALVWSVVAISYGQASVLGERVLPQLNLRAWKVRLLDAVADRCVRQSRRDPRDSAPADQMLYDQLEHALDTCQKGQHVELAIQSDHWYQNLILRPEEIVAFCAALAGAALDGLQGLLGQLALDHPPRLVVVSESVGRLPGLLEALEDSGRAPVPVVHLPLEAAARAAHALAVRLRRGDLAPGHNDVAIPLPLHSQKVSKENATPRIGPILRSGF